MRVTAPPRLTIKRGAFKLALIVLLFPTVAVAQKISTEAEIATDIGEVPCEDKKRLEAVKKLFQKMGAEPESIRIVKRTGVQNVEITMPGQSAETIVIGAHYDKAELGCGAIDNWSGIVTVAHLYRSLKEASLKKTLVFVAFDQEEKGLQGSKSMVDWFKKGDHYCEMINIDSLGLGAPQVANNLSSKKLTEATESIASRMKIPFGKAPIIGAGADSESFIRKGIPAVTIHGLSANWKSFLHTANDKAAKVLADSVYLGYRLALALAYETTEAACDEYK